MIIKTKLTGRFATIPNAIFEDLRLSVGAKGTLGYLLSRPPNWTVRHDQLRIALRVGRKALESIFKELINAGYMQRDAKQSRDEFNRFTTLNYIVRNVPLPRNDAASTLSSAVPKARRREPQHATNTGNNKEGSKTNSNNLPPPPFPQPQTERPEAGREEYSNYGRHALEIGLTKVFENSDPFKAWVRFRGVDGTPPFDFVVIGGQTRRVVWMPTLYPRDHVTAEERHTHSDSADYAATDHGHDEPAKPGQEGRGD